MSQDNRFNLDDDDNGQSQGSAPAGSHDHGGGGGGGGGDGGDETDYASPERFNKDRLRLVKFLQYPDEKRKITDFLEDTYKAIEGENVERTIQRVIHEHKSELDGSTPYYKPGHIGSLLYEYLNMCGVEASFVSGLQHTKSSMTKTVQQRVDEINTLLRGVGGFNRQIKASFSRSAVVYLEQEDPRNTYRERVIFTVNLADFELRYPLDESSADQQVEDGRSLRRMVWDEAVNSLAEIVSNTGMKPKYVKNDKNKCAFTMRQLLLNEEDEMPDEFFSFELYHMNDDTRGFMTDTYVSTIDKFNQKIAKCQKNLQRWGKASKDKQDILKQEILIHEKERDFYTAVTPDPREMDTGLVFTISANTLKDYHLTKDKMQVIMTKFILALSSIATDKSMDQQVNTVYQRKQAKAQNFQTMDVKVTRNAKKPKKPA